MMQKMKTSKSSCSKLLMNVEKNSYDVQMYHPDDVEDSLSPSPTVVVVVVVVEYPSR